RIERRPDFVDEDLLLPIDGSLVELPKLLRSTNGREGGAVVQRLVDRDAIQKFVRNGKRIFAPAEREPGLIQAGLTAVEELIQRDGIGGWIGVRPCVLVIGQPIYEPERAEQSAGFRPGKGVGTLEVSRVTRLQIHLRQHLTPGLPDLGLSVVDIEPGLLHHVIVGERDLDRLIERDGDWCVLCRGRSLKQAEGADENKKDDIYRSSHDFYLAYGVREGWPIPTRSEAVKRVQISDRGFRQSQSRPSSRKEVRKRADSSGGGTSRSSRDTTPWSTSRQPARHVCMGYPFTFPRTMCAMDVGEKLRITPFFNAASIAGSIACVMRSLRSVKYLAFCGSSLKVIRCPSLIMIMNTSCRSMKKARRLARKCSKTSRNGCCSINSGLNV